MNQTARRLSPMKLEIDLAPILEDKLVVSTVTLLEYLLQDWQETDADAMISALHTAPCAGLGRGRRDDGSHKSAHTQHQLECNPGAALPEMRSGCPNPQRSTQERVAGKVQSTRAVLTSLTHRFRTAPSMGGPIPGDAAASTATKTPIFTPSLGRIGPSR
jgi:hypothetical protein